MAEKLHVVKSKRVRTLNSDPMEKEQLRRWIDCISGEMHDLIIKNGDQEVIDYYQFFGFN